MNAKLANSLDLRVYENSSEKDVFFSGEEERLGQFLARENVRNSMSACDTNLFIGVFVEGTGNNYAESFDKQDYSQSNVARLYSAYPGQSVPGVLPPGPNRQTEFSTIDRLCHGLMSRPAMLAHQSKTLGFRGAL